MRFWDTSAVIPLIVEETTSPVTESTLREDEDMAVWWGAEVECVSGLSRIFREREFGAAQVEQSLQRLGALITG